MADEQKTVEEQETQPQKVEITQEKLDKLINEKYAKGAEKATTELLNGLGVESVDDLKSIIEAKREAEEAQKTELQKLQEQLEEKTKEAEAAKAEKEKSDKEASLTALAARNGITELDYFKVEVAKGYEDEKAFIESLKESKPFLFGNKQATQTPKGDASQNKGEPSLQDQLNGLSFKELQKLQESM